MSEQLEEELTNVSLTNILACSIISNDNRLEIPIDLALQDFGNTQIALSYDEDRRMLILELVEMENVADESGQDSEEPTQDGN
jgi:hypothetical protein